MRAITIIAPQANPVYLDKEKKTLDTVRRQTNIVFTQLKYLIATLAVVMVLMGGGAVWQHQIQSEQTTEQEQVAERNHFYRVIAGEEATRSNKASDKLAIKLHGWLEEGAPESEFVADSLDFPGVSQQLGFNPFNPGSRACEECGNLSQGLQEDLEVIQNGQVDSLVTPVPQADTHIQVTPFGEPIWLSLFWIWQLAGGIGLWRGLKQNGGRRLTWQRDGVADQPEHLSWLLSPLPHALYQPYNRWRLRQLAAEDTQVLGRMGLLDDLADIAAVKRALRERQPTTVAEASEIERLQEQLDKQEREIKALPAELSQEQLAVVSDGSIEQAQRVLDESALKVEIYRDARKEARQASGGLV